MFFLCVFCEFCKWVVNDKPFCKTAVSKKCVRRVDLHVLQNMSSGHRILSAFRFLSYPMKIIKVIIHKHKISKSKDEKYAVIGVRTFNCKASGQRSTILPPRQPNCDKY